MGISHEDAQLHLAWTLLHFLWMACIPAAFLHLATRWLPTRSIELRYRISVLSLALLLPLFVLATRMGRTEDSRVAQQTRVITRDGGVPNASGTFERQPNADDDAGFDVVAGPVSEESLEVAASAVTMTAKQTEQAVNIPWARVITTLYFLGVTICSLRLLIGYLSSRRLRRSATPVVEGEMQQLAQRIASRIRLRATPMICWSERIVVPAVVGVLRPAVLLPTAIANGLTIEQLEHILLHEFTHLRRFDPLVNFLQNVLETLFFFHPLVWWISSQVRLYRELSCDDAVVACGVSPKQYADTLIDIAFRSKAPSAGNLSIVSSIASRPQLRTRLSRLLGHSPQPPRWPMRLADGMSLIVVLGIVAVLLTSTISDTLAAPQQVKDATAQSEQPVVADAILKNLPKSIEPTELAGIVVNAEGKPLPGVTVDAWSWYTGDETTTDQNGVFRFRPDSDEGRSKVEIRWSKSGYAPHYIAQQPVGVKDLVITLDDKTFIEGRIIAVDGSPAAGVTVRGAQKDIEGDGVMISEVVTETVADESGNYRMYVFPDTYELTIASAMGVSRLASIAVPSGQSVRRDIQLEPGVRFEAIVTDVTTRKRFSGLVLSSFMQSQFRGTSDADGRIVIEGMLPGTFEFEIGAGEPLEYKGMTYFRNGPLGRWWSPDAVKTWERLDRKTGQFQRNFDHLSFDLKPGMSAVQINVEQGVEFSGHVYDPDGKPREGATVAPAKTGSGNSLTGDTRYSVETEADGSYKVIMPAGNDFQYNLMAFDGEYGKWRTWGAVARDPLPTRPGQKVTDYDFQLTRGATVRGKVLLQDEVGAAPRQVRAHPADLRGNRYYDPTVEVQPDGSFELRGLRPGKHFIQVSPFWLSAKDSPDGNSVTIEVAEGETKEGIELKPADP
jgi:beta-lactamase regulating signal transducer with metallopeptidase domain